MLEAFPQLIIQTLFVVKSGQFDGFVTVSTVFSMLSMVNKAVSEDKQLFVKKTNFTCFPRNWQDAQWTYKTFPCVNIRYLIRVLFRIFDISHRVLIIVLVWTQLGGVFVMIAATIEFCVLFAIVIKTKELSVVFALWYW